MNFVIHIHSIIKFVGFELFVYKINIFFLFKHILLQSLRYCEKSKSFLLSSQSFCRQSYIQFAFQTFVCRKTKAIKTIKTITITTFEVFIVYEFYFSFKKIFFFNYFDIEK